MQNEQGIVQPRLMCTFFSHVNRCTAVCLEDVVLVWIFCLTGLYSSFWTGRGRKTLPSQCIAVLAVVPSPDVQTDTLWWENEVIAVFAKCSLIWQLVRQELNPCLTAVRCCLTHGFFYHRYSAVIWQFVTSIWLSSDRWLFMSALSDCRTSLCECHIVFIGIVTPVKALSIQLGSN